ncbi:MAG: decarboxylating 6-phosphogluconate dehydrogenase, partial [Alphaproteobacteria bacterium]|nr:decarboxylating 6-phosphogluconate dehydrogenase [Alphaproteobacteria bacterium]
MQLGMIGLGRMGGNIVRRLMKGGHTCVVYDKSAEAVQGLAGEGATPSRDLAGFVKELSAPRAVWVMLPAGAITHGTIVELSRLLSAGDTLIDGGNSFFQDDIRHAELLNAKGIRYLDVGTSGGVWGLERGYCMMIGGDKEAADHLDPIFKTLAPGVGTIERTSGRQGRDPRVENGYLYCGPAGAGHFVKMVHNGIEYGLMQAYGEGFDIMRNANSKELPDPHQYHLDLGEIAELWRRGSVVSSWLLDLSAIALAEDPN